MKTRVRRPIRLKALAAEPTRDLAAMQADLEGRSSARRAKTARALWTHEFLASGKFGKVAEN